MRSQRYALALGLLLCGGWMGAAHATPVNAPVITGLALEPHDGLGVQIEAVAVHRVEGRPVLHGHVRSDAQAGLSASRRVRIDIIDEDGLVKRTAYERIVTQNPVRRSRLKARGGFSLAVPSLQPTDRVQITIVRAEEARRNPER